MKSSDFRHDAVFRSTSARNWALVLLHVMFLQLLGVPRRGSLFPNTAQLSKKSWISACFAIALPACSERNLLSGPVRFSRRVLLREFGGAKEIHRTRKCRTGPLRPEPSARMWWRPTAASRSRHTPALALAQRMTMVARCCEEFWGSLARLFASRETIMRSKCRAFRMRNGERTDCFRTRGRISRAACLKPEIPAPRCYRGSGVVWSSYLTSAAPARLSGQGAS